MKWRFIDLEVNDAFYNMAVDQAVSESVYRKEALPTIRLYRWSPAAVSLSSYQDESDVDLELCKKLGIDCVRRVTGGGLFSTAVRILLTAWSCLLSPWTLTSFTGRFALG